MKTADILRKLRSLHLCLMAHPDNTEGSEFEDRISDVEEIMKSYASQPMSAEQVDYQIGDKVEIIKSENGHEFNLGEIVSICEFDKESILCVNKKGEKWWVERNEIKPDTSPTVKADERKGYGHDFLAKDMYWKQCGKCGIIQPINDSYLNR